MILTYSFGVGQDLITGTSLWLGLRVLEKTCLHVGVLGATDGHTPLCRRVKLWEAIAAKGARVPGGVAKHLPSLKSRSHLLGDQGSRPVLNQGPGCMCTAHHPTVEYMKSHEHYPTY